MRMTRCLGIRVSSTISLCGGFVEERSYYDALADAIVRKRPTARIVPAKYEPVAGALLLAYREAELSVTELHA